MTDAFSQSETSTRAEWLMTYWQGLATTLCPSNQEIDTSLPLPLVVGCNTEMKPYLMLLSSIRPNHPKGFEAIAITIGARHSITSERWSLTFTLLDWGLLHAFAELSSALIERVGRTTTAQEALKQVYITVDQWQRLLRVARGNDQLRMLRATIAELTAARIISTLTSRPIEDVCNNWTGPYQAPQDFIFTDVQTAYEVKSSYPSTRKLVISSAEQLGDSHLTHLELINITLESTPKTHPAANNLLTVIDLLRECSNMPSTLTKCIEARLDAIGISPYSNFVSESYFHVERAQIYVVDKKFPRIMANQIPDNITNLSYELRIADIQPFCVQTINNPLAQDNE